MSVKLLTQRHLEFLSLTGGCTGSSESTLVKMPHCWKSHVAAHLLIRVYGYLSHGRPVMNQTCLLIYAVSLDQSLITVNQEIFGRILFSQIALKDIFATLKIRD